MPRHLRVAGATLCALATMTVLSPPAHAWTLGVGDRADAPAAPTAALGARVYRVVIDPAIPLDQYAARIQAHRAVGQEPQLVIGGTGTAGHASSRGVVRAAVAAARRWPSAYSVGVVNEPNESGMGVCEYARTWTQAYVSLRAVGVRRIPFGEWSPDHPLEWQAATYHRCPTSSPRVRRWAKRIAWHGYGPAIGYGQAFRALARQYHAVSPRLMVTEAGAVLRCRVTMIGPSGADAAGMRYWRAALRTARRDRLDELVAWDVTAPPASSAWDSSLIERSGRPRPAFHLIAAHRR